MAHFPVVGYLSSLVVDVKGYRAQQSDVLVEQSPFPFKRDLSNNLMNIHNVACDLRSIETFHG